MELTTKIIIGAATLGLGAFLLWPETSKASQTKAPAPGSSLNLADVKGVQKGLLAMGYSVGADGADGWFGENTVNVVRKFSKEHGGPDSGKITDSFRKLLATSLRAKGYVVTGETGPTFDKTTGPTHGGVLVTGTRVLDALVGACKNIVGASPYEGGPSLVGRRPGGHHGGGLGGGHPGPGPGHPPGPRPGPGPGPGPGHHHPGHRRHWRHGGRSWNGYIFGDGTGWWGGYWPTWDYDVCIESLPLEVRAHVDAAVIAKDSATLSAMSSQARVQGWLCAARELSELAIHARG